MSLPQLYTSHYRSPLLADVDAQAVAISRGVPRWPLPFSCRRLMALAPSRETFALDDPAEFERSYLAGLDALGPDRVADDLRRVAGGRTLVLLCWEDLSKPGQWCHREQLACWLHDRLGVEANELQPGDLCSCEHRNEPTLF